MVWQLSRWEYDSSTRMPNHRPRIVARCGPDTIIAHIIPFGSGANGRLAGSSVRQAARACGWLPPTGRQRRVHRCGTAPGRGVTVITSETSGAAGLPVPAGTLPQPASTATHPRAASSLRPSRGHRAGRGRGGVPGGVLITPV